MEVPKGSSGVLDLEIRVVAAIDGRIKAEPRFQRQAARKNLIGHEYLGHSSGQVKNLLPQHSASGTLSERDPHRAIHPSAMSISPPHRRSIPTMTASRLQ